MTYRDFGPPDSRCLDGKLHEFLRQGGTTIRTAYVDRHRHYTRRETVVIVYCRHCLTQRTLSTGHAYHRPFLD